MESIGTNIIDNIGFDNSILNYESISAFENIKNIEINFENGDKIILDLKKCEYNKDGFAYAFSMQNINFNIFESYGKIKEIILPVFLEKKFNSDFEVARINEIMASKANGLIY